MGFRAAYYPLGFFVAVRGALCKSLRPPSTSGTSRAFLHGSVHKVAVSYKQHKWSPPAPRLEVAEIFVPYFATQPEAMWYVPEGRVSPVFVFSLCVLAGVVVAVCVLTSQQVSSRRMC